MKPITAAAGPGPPRGGVIPETGNRGIEHHPPIIMVCMGFLNKIGFFRMSILNVADKWKWGYGDKTAIPVLSCAVLPVCLAS